MLRGSLQPAMRTRFLSMAIAALVLFASALVGQTYRLCAMLQAAEDCCDKQVAAAPWSAEPPASLECGCCETKRIELPSGQASTPRLDVPIDVDPIAVLPPPDDRNQAAPLARDTGPCGRPADKPRARAPTAAARCATLQVFRC